MALMIVETSQMSQKLHVPPSTLSALLSLTVIGVTLAVTSTGKCE